MKNSLAFSHWDFFFSRRRFAFHNPRFPQLRTRPSHESFGELIAATFSFAEKLSLRRIPNVEQISE
jgi:hypothetical protein